MSQEKRDLAMACGRFNRYANRTNMLSEYAQFKLSLVAAPELVNDLQIGLAVAAALWHDYKANAGADADKA